MEAGARVGHGLGVAVGRMSSTHPELSSIRVVGVTVAAAVAAAGAVGTASGGCAWCCSSRGVSARLRRASPPASRAIARTAAPRSVRPRRPRRALEVLKPGSWPLTPPP
ncbi:MAG: hypothetical protein MUE90_08245 [Thermoanaerobaculales bacterium]|nr:hypothetical protein [Thermoanaerobaculales bacterium]